MNKNCNKTKRSFAFLDSKNNNNKKKNYKRQLLHYRRKYVCFGRLKFTYLYIKFM